jgi:hypothetical protein
VPALIDQRIVVAEFFAALNITQGVNVDTAVVMFERLAVRFT